MSFGDCFDRTCVIHSSRLAPERRAHFEAALRGVGLGEPEIIEPATIEPGDARLSAYPTDGARLVSLIDSFGRAIASARRSRAQIVAIFEDDIKFRRGFEGHWREVEPQLATVPWDVLVLHRTRSETGGPLIERHGANIELVPILDNTLMQCVIVHRRGYDKFEAALDLCLARGWPADFFYGAFTRGSDPGRIYATSKNLTGQQSGLRSALQNGRVRKVWFHSEFACYRNPLEYAMVAGARAIKGALGM